MTKSVEEAYMAVITESVFDFESYDKYGEDHKILCQRNPGKPRHAVQMKEAGEVDTREGKASYKAGDWILTDEQGGQYPVDGEKFGKLYDAKNPLEGDMYNPLPVKKTFFRTDKKLDIKTEWGDYVASPGDYVTVDDAGTIGCPVKPDAMQTGYKFIKEL